jgi:hypothetical protein
MIRRTTTTFIAACGTGIVSGACELAFVLALGWALPDRDTTLEGLAGALVIGTLAAFVSRQSDEALK